MNEQAQGPSASQAARAREIAERIETLPLLPSVLVRVLALDPEGDAYFDQLVELAAQEPNLAVRVLRFANSAASAPGRPILTIFQAAMRIGTRECTHMITALAVARVFVPRTPAQRELWQHALLVAHIARAIARRDNQSREARDQSYLAGLLHDIGRFAMFEQAQPDLDRVAEADWESPDELLATEEQLLGYDHAQLGGLICARWELPELLQQVVLLHHEPMLPPSATRGALGEELRIVRLADTAAMAVARHPALLELPPPQLADALAGPCARTELGKEAIIRQYLAERLPKAVHEAQLAAEQLLGPDPAAGLSPRR